MYTREGILNRFKDYEDRLLANRVFDSMETCRKTRGACFTDFLDPRQRQLIEGMLRYGDGINYFFAGGVEGCERNICAIYHEDADTGEVEPPIALLLFTWHEGGRKLSHRDFLGSILGSGIKREKIGDIILDENKAYIACHKDISRYLLQNVTKVGNTPVSVRETDMAVKKPGALKLISSTVASLRLDCIVGCGYGVSRSKAAEYIKSGKVRLNWEETMNTSRELKAGDTVSLRGKGRIVLDEVSGTTKKDRIKVTIKKYM